jgi:pimeloyl-ACP methyl ester carboxylesterase
LAHDIADLQDQFTLVFHDYRGSGSSAVAPRETYDFEHLADDLEQLRAHRGDECIDVLAHSMGVPVALHFALRHQSSLRSMVLVGGTPISARRVPWSVMRALGPVRLARIFSKSLVYFVRWSWRPESSRRSAALGSLSEVVGESRREFRHSESSRPLRHNDNVSRLQHAFLEVDLTERLSVINQPVLVLYGSRDAVAAAGAPRFAGLPSAEFVVLPGIGHEVFTDAPDIALQAITAFFARQREQAP